MVGRHHALVLYSEQEPQFGLSTLCIVLEPLQKSNFSSNFSMNPLDSSMSSKSCSTAAIKLVVPPTIIERFIKNSDGESVWYVYICIPSVSVFRIQASLINLARYCFVIALESLIRVPKSSLASVSSEKRRLRLPKTSTIRRL